MPLLSKQQKLAILLKNIAAKQARNEPLTVFEEQLVAEVVSQQVQKRTIQHTLTPDNQIVVKRQLDCEPTMLHVKDKAEALSDVPIVQRNGRYLGSIDPVTAANFTREVGKGPGSKEFAEYAMRKLNSTHTKFRADYK